MHWILQAELFKENEWEKLIATLTRFDLPYSVHKVIPFIGQLIPPAQPLADKVICFGSYSMRHTAKAMDWNPGVYDFFNVNFIEQREHWGDELLNADSDILAFKDVVLTAPAFIRPFDDSKYFSGRVFEPNEWNKWRGEVTAAGYDYENSLRPETPVQICKPKTIYAEYRYWIVDGEIVTRSLYKRGDRVIYSANVDLEVDRYVSGVTRGTIFAISNQRLLWLPGAFVIDVCKTPNGFKIVEINNINSAGFYAGNVQDIVMALEQMERNR